MRDSKAEVTASFKSVRQESDIASAYRVSGSVFLKWFLLASLESVHLRTASKSVQPIDSPSYQGDLDVLTLWFSSIRIGIELIIVGNLIQTHTFVIYALFFLFFDGCLKFVIVTVV